MIKPLPCICGHAAPRLEYDARLVPTFRWRVACDGCQQRTTWVWSESAAVELWNGSEHVNSAVTPPDAERLTDGHAVLVSGQAPQLRPPG